MKGGKEEGEEGSISRVYAPLQNLSKKTKIYSFAVKLMNLNVSLNNFNLIAGRFSQERNRL